MKIHKVSLDNLVQEKNHCLFSLQAFSHWVYQLGVSIFIRLNQDFFNGEVSRAIIFPITLSLATPKLSEESIEKTC